LNMEDPVNVVQTDGMEDDLIILSRWVKKEMFIKVKFLYNLEKDLRIDGAIYNMFLMDCKDRLVGLKLYADKSPDYKKLYVQALWNRATKKRRNLIADGLNTRRSSIYSATQNRFTGM
jgi:hypothetical protein